MNQPFLPRLLTVALAAMLSLGALAQQEIQWSHQVEVSPTSPEAMVVLTATMEPGWHLYDMDVPEDGPQATVISFDGSEGVVPQGGIVASVESVKAEDATYGIVIGAWEDTVSFTQRFLITQPQGLIKGKITFMACDQRNCMPPQNYTFTCEVSSSESQAQALKEKKAQDIKAQDIKPQDIKPQDIESCCCIGWGRKR